MIIIRRETLAIKQLLKELYPNEIFSVQLKQPSSYIWNSDKIIIRCSKSVNVQDVIHLLKQHAYGIDIYEKGSIGTIFNTKNTPYIKMSNGDRVDMDLVEFIEVG